MEKEVLEFLRDKIPMIYDLDKEDIVFDKKNMYYKLYKYVMDLRKEVNNVNSK